MGSAKAWDAARDQQLFLLIVNSVKVDWKVIADEWAKKYPDDTAKPTASAISQHIYKLQKANGGGGGGSSKPKAAGVFKPSTPSSATKRTVPKTPSSSAKRQKTRNMSDEDDSEDEKAVDYTPAKRESTARRSKSSRQTYAEPETDEEEDDDAGDFVTSARSASRSVNRLDGPSGFTSTGGYASPISKNNSVSPDDEVVVTASRSVGKKPMSNFDYFNRHGAGDDSDVSDFQPMV